jgi:uncharacterized protein YndB with AHSA1/START domain
MTTQRVERARTDSTVCWTEGTDLVYERVFDAPRDLIWRVMTDPERITHWWGPNGYSTTVVEMDVRVGGRWRFISHTTGGEDVPFTGEYLEVVPLERVVQTFIYDVPPFNEMAAIETFTLEDLGARTRVVNRSTFPSLEALEGALGSGMVRGAIESWDRLAAEIANG